MTCGLALMRGSNLSDTHTSPSMWGFARDEANISDKILTPGQNIFLLAWFHHFSMSYTPWIIFVFGKIQIFAPGVGIWVAWANFFVKISTPEPKFLSKSPPVGYIEGFGGTRRQPSRTSASRCPAPFRRKRKISALLFQSIWRAGGNELARGRIYFR